MMQASDQNTTGGDAQNTTEATPQNATGSSTQNATASVQTYSNATTVPAVVSVASLSNYATVAAFNTSERERVSYTCTLFIMLFMPYAIVFSINDMNFDGVYGNCSLL